MVTNQDDLITKTQLLPGILELQTADDPDGGFRLGQDTVCRISIVDIVDAATEAVEPDITAVAVFVGITTAGSAFVEQSNNSIFKRAEIREMMYVRGLDLLLDS